MNSSDPIEIEINDPPANLFKPSETKRLNSIAEIEIRDTGRGIAAEFLPHIFELCRQFSTFDDG